MLSSCRQSVSNVQQMPSTTFTFHSVRCDVTGEFRMMKILRNKNTRSTRRNTLCVVSSAIRFKALIKILVQLAVEKATNLFRKRTQKPITFQPNHPRKSMPCLKFSSKMKSLHFLPFLVPNCQSHTHTHAHNTTYRRSSVWSKQKNYISNRKGLFSWKPKKPSSFTFCIRKGWDMKKWKCAATLHGPVLNSTRKWHSCSRIGCCSRRKQNRRDEHTIRFRRRRVTAVPSLLF